MSAQHAPMATVVTTLVKHMTPDGRREAAEALRALPAERDSERKLYDSMAANLDEYTVRLAAESEGTDA